jgi:hypothetical protein
MRRLGVISMQANIGQIGFGIAKDCHSAAHFLVCTYPKGGGSARDCGMIAHIDQVP